MRTLEQHLTQYAAYHRDRRNIATHFVGIPMIVLGSAVLLSRPLLAVSGFPLAPVVLVTLLMTLFYLRLDLRFGVVMSAIMTANAWVGMRVASESLSVWAASGLGLFFVGWVIQFVGHYFEQKKPAFVDDLVGLAVGPLFVVAEFAFILGLRKDVQSAIEAKVGPTLIKERPRAAA